MDQPTSSTWEEFLRRTTLVVLFFTVYMSFAFRPLEDPDVWWHLAVGRWIWEHGLVPGYDPLSLGGGDRVWAAYSWLFELLVYGVYSAAGRAGLVGLKIIGALAVLVTYFRLIRRREGHYTWACVLATAGAFIFLPLFTPRPWLFTMVFAIIEIDIISRALEKGDAKVLWPLPLLFIAWANIHIQFVYGLAILFFLVIDSLVRPRLPEDLRPQGDPLPIGPVIIALVASVGATLVTPYHFDLYRVIIEYSTEGTAFRLIDELTAPDFRRPWDWWCLVLALGGTAVMGWHRKVSPFWWLLLAFSIYVGFKAQRDAWLLAVVATTYLAGHPLLPRREDDYRLTWGQVGVVVGVLLVYLPLLWLSRPLSHRDLTAMEKSLYPYRALEVLEKGDFEGPMYNHLNWGGYLAWNFPDLPVSIDGRTNLHGEIRLVRSHQTWNGLNWQKDPELARARIVIGPVDAPLAFLLKMSPQWKLIHQDKTAVVFLRR